MNRKIFTCAILLLASSALAEGTARAQLDPPGEPRFKVGDRVEYDSLQASDPSRAKWVKATVVRIDVLKLGGGSLTQTSYVIKTETGYEVSVTRRHAELGHSIGDARTATGTGGFLRPLASGDAAPPDEDKPPDANNPPPGANGPTGDRNGPTAPNARAGGTKYKQGDCVDFDVLQTGNPARAQWKKGTIIKVEPVKLSSTQTQTNYVVQLDPLPNQLPEIVKVSQRLAEGGMTYAGEANRTTGFLRPRDCGGAAPNIESAKLRVDANGTVLADRELLDCDSVKAGPARNGQRPDPEMVKKLIRCLWEHPAKPGEDGAQKMDILQFTPGPSRRWDPNNDMGSGATLETSVYQFRVKYNVEGFYHEFNRLDMNHDGIFTCFVGNGIWQCGLAQTTNPGQTKMIQITK